MQAEVARDVARFLARPEPATKANGAAFLPTDRCLARKWALRRDRNTADRRHLGIAAWWYQVFEITNATPDLFIAR